MSFNTLAEVLEWRGRNEPEKCAFVFLGGGEVDRAERITYAGLEERARKIARLLRLNGQPGRPVVLLLPPSLELVASLFGCFFAGAIAVVVDVPRRAAALPALEAILEDTGSDVILTSRDDGVESLLVQSELLRRLRRITVEDALEGSSAAPPGDAAPVRPDSIAVLQYTSGSTGAPKGVMVTHGNIVHNSRSIQLRFEQDERSCAVLWVPPSHDMGLVGGICHPCYSGYPGVLLPPLAFLQKPIRWLQAISAFRATIVAAPNFAYDLCVRKIAPAQLEGLDLSSLQVAINGAEPVHARTIDEFCRAFEPCGFRRSAFCPSYGLAEATLLVSGQKNATGPAIRHRGGGMMQKETVSCGGPTEQGQVLIVDPELRMPCAEGDTGEIWVGGGSVAKGYWNRAGETADAFGAYLSSSGQGPFLRTGDLGCLIHGELYVTGRLKDLIIVRGVNHSPEAIEQTVEACSPALTTAGGAAFTVDSEDQGERLIVVHELARQFARLFAEEEIFDAIRRSVAEQHGLEVHGIVLLRTASLPRTSTGKVRRHSCREAFLSGGLKEVARWMAEAGSARAPVVEPAAAGSDARQQGLRLWLLERLSQRLAVPAAELDSSRPFSDYGIDSAAIVELAGDLEDYLGVELSPTLIYDYPTVDMLCAHLATSFVPATKSAAGGAG